MLEELHSNGKTIEDIVHCLKQVPLCPRIVTAIKSAHALGYYPLSSWFTSCFLFLSLVEKLIVPKMLGFADVI